MAVHARKDPDPKHPGADLTALVPALQKIGDAHGAFAAHLQHRESCDPILCQPMVLTAAQPIDTDQAGHHSRSLAVLNPNALTIYWGIGGASPQPGQRAIAQPPKSLMVLPVRAQDFQVGASATDLAAGDAVVFLWRYETLERAFLGASL
ncbi:MAG: hypothetical protein JWR63_4296 [Conexibacter sp.]|nr:hypothetical protein [Conexibacter sp.]